MRLREILLGLASLLIWLIAIPDRRAAADERLALLIGNQAYKENIGPLKNPHNDVNLIEGSLKQLGFKVTVIKDASYKAMDSALKRYVTEVRRAGRNALSFFHYSGHGVANPETQINYLIPVDVTDVDDDKVWFESLQQNTIIDLLSKQAPMPRTTSCLMPAATSSTSPGRRPRRSARTRASFRSRTRRGY